MKRENILLLGTDVRSVNLLKELHDLDALPSGFGEGGANLTTDDAFAAVPWVFRGVTLKADAISSMPYSFMRGKDDVTQAADYVRLNKNMKQLLWRTSASLDLYAAAYWFKAANELGGNVTPQWIATHTIELVRDSKSGLKGFKRTVGGESKEFPKEKMVYFWTTSLNDEMGPGVASVDVALEAAGVLRNSDRMTSSYFKRGAIKTTLISVPPETEKDEADRIEAWWQRIISGIKNAYSSVVVRAQGIVPVVIGSDLKDTSVPELTEKKREDIATALGIPQSMLWTSSAYATARHSDRLTFMEQTVIPSFGRIAEVLNEQLLADEGLVMVAHPEQLPLMQQAQLDKAMSLSQLVGGAGGVAILNVDEARQLIGYGPMVKEEAPTPTQAKALRQWRDAACKRVRENKSAAFEFQTDAPLSPKLRYTILTALTEAHTLEDVKAVFEGHLDGQTERA